MLLHSISDSINAVKKSKIIKLKNVNNKNGRKFSILNSIVNLKNILIIIFILSIILSFYAETFIYKNIYISYERPVSIKRIEKLVDLLNEAENFFIDKFDYVPKEKLDLFIFNSVNEMMNILNMPYWIGAYFNNNYVYLQPLDVLEKKNMLKRIVFIEYAHYYINDITNNNCPLWLNEMLSSYYCKSFMKDKMTLNNEIKIINNFSELKEISNIFKNYDFSKSFYYSSGLFIDYINNKFNNQVYDMVLFKIKDGYDINTVFYEITGDKMDSLYNHDFCKEFANEN